MASLPLSASLLPAAPGRRLAGILATVLVHAALILAWHVARTQPPGQADAEGPLMQWIDLPPPVPATVSPPVLPPVETRQPARPAAGRSARSSPARAPAAATAAAADAAPVVEQRAPESAAETVTPATPSAAAILENARRSVAGIDRALRKESKPTIVAPPDSPELRMRRGMEQAHALAPPRLWEAPKVEELVNNTGDGARRTRVITGRGTYCITERSPATNVEMIEMHGKIRLTNCPAPEEPAKRQEWRTARD